ncbi:cytochrome P450 [Mycena vulgaris]|nr:cytochrome P450 [Mycena vulgaris]
MQSDLLVLAATAAALLCILLRNRRVRSTLANIPGPPPVSLWKGNLPQIFDVNGWDFPGQITRQYGRVAKMRGLFGKEILYVSDPRVVRRVLLNFPPPAMVVESHNLINGSGLLGTMGDQHKKQRKMLNPLFAVKHLKSLTPMFFRMSQKLRDTILYQIGVNEKPHILNMHYWVSRLTLELISQAAFGQSLDPLNSEDSVHPYTVAVRAVLPAALPLSVFRLITPYVKYLGPRGLRKWLVNALPWPALNEMGKVVDVIHNTAVATYEEKKNIDLDDPSHKDVMSVLLNANNRASNEDRLPENEVIAQMGTLTFAAHDTTPNALSRILWHLGQNQTVQDKLRAEILAAELDLDNPDSAQLYEDLMALPYLDAVLRETLRLHPPVAMIQRRADVDTTIPLWKPITGINGNEITALNVTKGTDFILASISAHRDPEMWGQDALEFKPERWLSPLPDAVADAALPGVYFQILPFGGGFKACIGFKFAELQMKVNLYTLLSAFKIEPSGDKIVWNMNMVATPSVEGVKGSQLPMKISKLN